MLFEAKGALLGVNQMDTMPKTYTSRIIQIASIQMPPPPPHKLYFLIFLRVSFKHSCQGFASIGNTLFRVRLPLGRFGCGSKLGGANRRFWSILLARACKPFWNSGLLSFLLSNLSPSESLFIFLAPAAFG